MGERFKLNFLGEWRLASKVIIVAANSLLCLQLLDSSKQTFNGRVRVRKSLGP